MGGGSYKTSQSTYTYIGGSNVGINESMLHLTRVHYNLPFYYLLSFSTLTNLADTQQHTDPSGRDISNIPNVSFRLYRTA
jgi:hypothetical protein